MKKQKIINGVAWTYGTAVFLFLLYGFVDSARCHGISSPEAASWIQAIGAIGAIAAAVWVMTRQHREAERNRSREEAKQQLRLLTSLRTEIHAKRTQYMANSGDVVSQLEEGQIFEYQYRYVPNQFHVFDSHVSQLGLIESDKLRERIITGYGLFKNLIFVIEMNTDILEERDAEMLAAGDSFPKDRKELYEKKLLRMTTQIIQINRRSRELADEIMGLTSDEALHDLIRRTRD